ncbi:hypothetical protein NW762_012984 [Fusarium torreyae]|uniref:Uncharacterized protein n=1 Tax=Fusarium torreyae TaxID=1237075 RepID=A0A9W8VAU9_9HYPO|nr:hypothetical protein NW762_012984 [Fusarium torreyae]
MAPPQAYAYGNQQSYQQNAPPPPPYGYYPPYQAQPQGPPPPRRRSPRQNYAVSTARQFSLAIPFIIVILTIWWSIRQQTCPNGVDAGHECSWMLWTSLPVAIVSAIWGIIMNISARRATHHMSHVPPVVNAVVQLILALGTTACFAILIYHMENYFVWSRGAEGAMIALLVILAIINWILFGWAVYEMNFYRRERQHENNQIPI